jgi:membrane protein
MSRPNNPAQAAHSPRYGRGPVPLMVRTVSRAWENNIFSEAAATAFWETLSLPPLLLGLLGSLGFVGDWFGPAVVDSVHTKILSFARTVFTANVVDEIIGPTVSGILTQGRSEIVSVGFLLSLWAGSSALASLVDAITVAYNQYLVRHSVWQRIFALLLYLVGLVLAVVGLPIIALGPDWLSTLFPPQSRQDVAGLIHGLYYPAIAVALVLALTALYKLALPRKLPWHRGLPGAMLAMLVFLCTSTGLRLYIMWVTSTGYTYGALATPIAFLLFAFFIAFAIIIGAEFNSAIQELWPARMTRAERRRWRRLEMRRIAQRWQTEQGYGREQQPDGDTTSATENDTGASQQHHRAAREPRGR